MLQQKQQWWQCFLLGLPQVLFLLLFLLLPYILFSYLIYYSSGCKNTVTDNPFVLLTSPATGACLYNGCAPIVNATLELSALPAPPGRVTSLALTYVAK